MQIKLVSVPNSVLLSIKCMRYFNPSASPVVFNPLLFSRGVITIHLDVLDGDVVALALFVYYYILVLFICNLR